MRSLAVCAALVGLTVAAYWGVWDYPFINLDDELYVYGNPHVKTGLTWDNFVWSWGIHGEGQWHPLAWWSHQADCQLFGAAPQSAGWHHLTNLLLHIAAALVLLGALTRLTGAFWPSALVAALFALHPLSVESVAWISERRDVLSMLLMGLTLWAYAAYAEAGSAWRYLLTMMLFALGLMAKPMLVTLPCVLLLLDFWPLRRIRGLAEPADARERCPPRPAWWLIVEKLPLLVLAGVSAWLSYLCQQESGAVGSLAKYPFSLRLINAVVSYALYLRNMLWPVHLGPIYPLRQTFEIWQVAGAAALLLAITGVAVGLARRLPYLLVGWLWFLGTLVPVIGLLRLGVAVSMADRYAYMPMIGIYLAVAWGTRDVVLRWTPARYIVPLAAGFWLALLLLATSRQVAFWQDSRALFERALQVEYDNPYAHYYLGTVLLRKDDAQAIAHLREALKREPDIAEAHGNLGAALHAQEKYDEAIRHYQQALRLKPYLFEIETNLGAALEATGRLDEAIEQYQQALQEESIHVPTRVRLGLALAQNGRYSEAVEQLRAALALEPDNAEILEHLRKYEPLLQQEPAPAGP